MKFGSLTVITKLKFNFSDRSADCHANEKDNKRNQNKPKTAFNILTFNDHKQTRQTLVCTNNGRGHRISRFNNQKTGKQWCATEDESE